MYLPRSSKWSMNRRRRRPNYFGWVIFALVVLFGYYFNRVYLPTQPNPFEATPTPTRAPESYVTEAQALFKDGKLSQAIDAYQAAINASPQDPSLYIAIARVQVWVGKYAEAQANAENALLLSPNNAMAHAVHAWALDFQDGKNGEALNAIAKSLELDPNSALAHAYNVEILIDSGFDNYDKAIEESRVALALDQNMIETHRARGYLLSATENYEEAIREYDAAIKINPNIALLYLEQGKNYRAISAKDEAIQAFTKAITLNPSDPEPYYLISRTYATYGDYAKAMQYAESALQNNPGDAGLHGNLGVMYYRNFLWPEAVEQLGLTVFGGKTKDGVDVANIPLTNDARVAEYYYTLGLALARTNQCGEALQLAQEIQSKVPSDENATFGASEIIRICQERLNNPAVDTPIPTVPVETETPSPTSTP